MSSSIKYRSNLGVLRFLLALWVFFAHTVPWFALIHDHKLPVIGKIFGQLRKIQSNGELHPAVLGFLVLSGFVISSSFPMNKAGSTTRIKAWGIRRFFRIYPIYLLGIIFGLVFFTLSRSNSWNSRLSSTTEIIPGCVAAKATLLSVLTPIGYPNCALQGNSPLITAAAEMVLYMIYGAVLIFLTKRKVRFVYLIIFIVWLLSTITFVLASPNHPNFIGYWIHASPFNYLFPWWVGVYIYEKFPRITRGSLTSLLGPTLFFGSIWLLTRHRFNTSASNKFLIVELNIVFLSFAFALLIHLLEFAPQLPKRISNVENLGYALYALHAPLSLYLLFRGFGYLQILGINLSVALIAHLLIEKPLREFGRRLSKL